MEGFLTVRETAERAEVAQGTVYRWLYSHEVPLTKHKTATGRVLVEERELDAWLAARNTPVVVPVSAASSALTGIPS